MHLGTSISGKVCSPWKSFLNSHKKETKPKCLNHQSSSPTSLESLATPATHKLHHHVAPSLAWACMGSSMQPLCGYDASGRAMRCVGSSINCSNAQDHHPHKECPAHHYESSNSAWTKVLLQQEPENYAPASLKVQHERQLGGRVPAFCSRFPHFPLRPNQRSFFSHPR